MSDMKHRTGSHRSANVRRDAWDRRTRSDVSTTPDATTETNMGPEGESRVVRRTAAWDILGQSMPPEYLEMRIKGPIRGTSSPTLPGFPMVLHERGGSSSAGSGPELAFRFTDANGHERTMPERREPLAGPCIVSYAALVNGGQQQAGSGADWERGYLATIALCRMLVKERFEGTLDLASVGLDHRGGVVWVNPPEGHRGVPVAVSYVSELSRSSDHAVELVGQLGALFYRFVTGRPAASALDAASEVNLNAPPWVDTICNAALGEPGCSSVAEFLDLLHQHLTEEQREQVTPRLAEWALRSRRLSQPTEDAVAVQLGAALSHLGVAAARRARRRRIWLPIGVAAVATLVGLAVVLRNMHVI
jgi:hypothetical protein